MLAALNLQIFIVECGREKNNDEDGTPVELQIRNSLNWSVSLKLAMSLLEGIRSNCRDDRHISGEEVGVIY